MSDAKSRNYFEVRRFNVGRGWEGLGASAATFEYPCAPGAPKALFGYETRALAAFRFRPVRAPHDEVRLTGDEAARWEVIVAGRRVSAAEPAYDNRSEP